MFQNPGLPSSASSNMASEDTLLALAGLVTEAYDYFSVAYPTTTQEVYTYKTGGSGGTTVATVTINYIDATKVDISDASSI